MSEAEAQYREAIRPNQIPEGSDDAVRSGVVILYGAWLEPPYAISILDQELFLNGVRIDPPIVPPWKGGRDHVEPSEIGRQISESSGRIRTAYADLKREKQTRELQMALLEYIADAEGSVRRAEWETRDRLHIVMVEGAEFSINLAEGPEIHDPTQVRNEILLEAKQRYERSLDAGALLVIGCGAVLTVPSTDVEDARRQIEQALEERSLDRMKQTLHDRELVKEVLFLHGIPMGEE